MVCHFILQLFVHQSVGSEEKYAKTHTHVHAQSEVECAECQYTFKILQAQEVEHVAIDKYFAAEISLAVSQVVCYTKIESSGSVQ